MMKPNKKSMGSSYSYVDFDMDENEQKLMAFVTSGKLFCTRDIKNIPRQTRLFLFKVVQH